MGLVERYGRCQTWPGESHIQRREISLAIAFVSLLVIVIVVVVGIPILARVFSEATKRGEDDSGGGSGEDKNRNGRGNDRDSR
jgi:hypothetical protein